MPYLNFELAYHCWILLGGSGRKRFVRMSGIEEDGLNGHIAWRLHPHRMLWVATRARRTAADGLCTCVARRRGTRGLLRRLHARSRLRSLVDGDPGHPNHHLAAERRGTRRAPDLTAAVLALVDRARRGGRVDRQRDLVREPASLGAWLCRCERGRSNRRGVSSRSNPAGADPAADGPPAGIGVPRHWGAGSAGRQRDARERDRRRGRQEPIHDGLARVVVG